MKYLELSIIEWQNFYQKSLETETFWNRYKRQDNKKQSLGRIIKRALSMNVKKRPEIRKTQRNSETETNEKLPEEDLYDDLYTETYQHLFNEASNKESKKSRRPLNQKSKLNGRQLKHRSVSEMIL